MRAGVKSELQMLRELVWLHFSVTETEAALLHTSGLLIPALRGCFFCHKPLLIRPDKMTFGHSHHPPINVDITQHHIDENRENNDPSNLADCHSSCHRSHHMKKHHARRKEVVKQYEAKQKEITQENQKEGVLDVGR